MLAAHLINRAKEQSEGGWFWKLLESHVTFEVVKRLTAVFLRQAAERRWCQTGIVDCRD